MTIETILPKETLDQRYQMSTMEYKKFKELRAASFDKSHKLLNKLKQTVK